MPVDKEQIDRAWTSVRAAIARINAGEAHHEVCALCGARLDVEGLPPGGPFTQWLVHCPCGKSNGTLKGL